MPSRRFSFLILPLAASCVMLSVVTGCSPASDDSGPKSAAMSPYCPYLPTQRSFSLPTVTVTGRALFEYRIMGDLYLADGSFMVNTDPAGSGAYTVSVNGTQYQNASYASLVNDINMDPDVSATLVSKYSATQRSGSQSNVIKIVPRVSGQTITVVPGQHMLGTDRNGVTMGANLAPIRFAEVRVLDTASGTIVQCAETDSTGQYSFTIPQGSGNYQIEVTSRAVNSSNTAYVLRNPTANTYYSLIGSFVPTTTQTAAPLIARASGTYEAGAFNILDQIYKAQNYVRTKTAGCAGVFDDCTPFTTAPIVYTYWTPGLSPGVYFGSSGPISYYLNGQSQLYIGGGENGDVNESDMDQFDNSVIIHEYGHFIEDHFASPDSPGGSHDGNSIIDPRLAWGEGWADFFQAAVLFGDTGLPPVYRDTKGTIDCTGAPCYGVNYNESIDPNNLATNSSLSDLPTGNGEGIFHEFSVTRVLYQGVIGGHNFAEIWANFHGATRGMKGVNDPFKSMARMHVIQASATSASNWSPASTYDKQYTNQLREYATPLNTNQSTCLASNDQVSMAIKYAPFYDDGSFETSDLYNNNDFYRIDHPGGPINLTVSWSSGSSADLDLYIYPEGYVFGEGYVAASNAASFAVSASKNLSANLPAGRYLVNVFADTGPYYPNGGTYTTQYRLTLNGNRACANP